MTEEVPAAPTMPECNGNLPLEKGPLQVIDEIARSVGMAPYANAETGPDAPPAKENQQENRNSLSEDIVRGDFDGEKRCQDKPEENGGRLQRGSAQTQDAGSDGREPQEGPGSEGTPSGTPPGTPAGSGETGTAAGTPPASADGRGDAAQEEEEEEEELEEEEEDTEEDEVQVMELKKEKEEAPRPEQGSGREPAPPGPPGPNSPAEKPGEQPGPGKKNDISRHSYSRYNTISYRRIRKGNTKQRIDEFESMMHL